MSQPKYDEAGQLVTEGVTELVLQEVPFDTGSLAKMMLQIYERVGADDSFDPDTINGAINTTALAVENYKKELLDAIKNAKTFKTITIHNAQNDVVASQFSVIADEIADELSIYTNDPLYITGSAEDEETDGITLSLRMAQTVNESEYPISSKAVKTEVDNITSLIGDINKILNYVNTGVKPESL